MALSGAMNCTILALYGSRNESGPFWHFMAPETDHLWHFMAPYLKDLLFFVSV
jgi:hypothetical protein